MTTIISKSGTGIPASDKLETAELAVDTSNGNLYTKLDDGSVVQLNDGADDVDLSDYVTEAPIDTKQYVRQDGDWAEIVIPDGGTGAGMVISETEPADKVEGMQWLNPTNGLVLFWDGEKWLQMPGGVDGADGADGKGWTAGAYDDSTGVVTFDSDDGLGFSTGDLRGADGADGGTALVSDTEPSNPSSGTLWYDSANEALFVWDGNEWASVGSGSESPKGYATGGRLIEYEDDDGVAWRAHEFTSSGDLVVEEGDIQDVEYLIIAGGGGCSYTTYYAGGSGAGAGGYRSSVAGERSGADSDPESTITLIPETYNIIVGAGGTKGSGNPGTNASGSNSSAFGIESIGGGRGGDNFNYQAGTDGGSGSGSNNGGIRVGAGTAGQGCDGGQGFGPNDVDTNSRANKCGGGGGGSASTGTDAPDNQRGGNGGSATTSSITGAPVARAGGGGGAGRGGSGVGGGGGAADGAVSPSDALENTGSGGGGVSDPDGNPDYSAGSNGGSGVVIIRYRDPFA